MLVIKASKKVSDFATSEKLDKFGKTVVDHPTSEQTGNIARRKWPYDACALRQMDARIYVI